MPATEKVYPEWVQKYRTRGMTVKKKGESYYCTSELQSVSLAKNTRSQ